MSHRGKHWSSSYVRREPNGAGAMLRSMHPGVYQDVNDDTKVAIKRNWSGQWEIVRYYPSLCHCSARGFLPPKQ
ncbi:MAG: hypothetical protein WBC04_13520, partial [Candidatus Acidiferrales bacterium]